MHVRVLVLLVSFLSALPWLARGQPVDPETEIAHGHFVRGEKAYSEGRYREALEEFIAARTVKRLAAFDFNIGRCYEQLGELDQAIDAYQASADASVGAAALESRQRIVALRARIAEKRSLEAVPEPPPPPKVEPPKPIVQSPPPPTEPRLPPEERRPWLARHLLPVAVGVVAVALIAAGTGLVLSVGPQYNALVSGPTACSPACPPSSYSALTTRSDIGYALWAAGGAAVLLDAVLWTLDLRGRGRDPARRAFRLLPAPGGIAATGSF